MKIKKLIAIILTIIITLSLTGCVTEMKEYTTFEGAVTEYDVIKPEEIVEVNREEKEELYSNLLNIPEFCLYGNTFELLVEGENDEDNRYAYVMTDENVYVSIVKPVEKTNEREISLTIYKFKESNGLIQHYNQIEVIENGVLKTICLAPEPNSTNKIEKSEDAESFIKILNGLPTMKNVKTEYVHTNSEGIDTIKCTEEESTILIRVNAKTGEVHQFILIGKDGKKQIASFTYTDPATINRPTDYTDNKFDIWFYTKQYVSSIK